MRALLERADHPGTPQADATLAMTYHLVAKYDLDEGLLASLQTDLGSSQMIFLTRAMLFAASSVISARSPGLIFARRIAVAQPVVVPLLHPTCP